MLRRSIIAFGLIFLSPALGKTQPHFAFYEPVTPPRPVHVMVHRGMAIAAPENSARAIEMCIQDFCEWVEVDVRLSKDGQHVLIHNDTVDSTTDGVGRVADLTLDELKKLDAGSWFAKRFAGNRIMTLPEALAVAKGKVNLYLDCKAITPELLVSELIAAGMGRQAIVYATPDVLEMVKAASNGTIARMTKYRPVMPFDAFVKEVGPAAVEIDANEISAELCQKFHASGIKVQAKLLGEYCENPEVWGAAIDAGADWLQTDNPVGIRFFDIRRRLNKFPVMIACHRGASRYAPENTIPAIRAASQLGADFAEIDIRTTKDGQTILMHDGTVNRTTNRDGRVRDYSYEEVTSLPAGAWFGKRFAEIRVPSFEEGLAELGHNMGVYLDSKDIAPEELIAAIKKFDLTERHVVYQSLRYCGRLRQLDETVRTMPPLHNLNELDAVAAIKAYAVDASWSILSKEMISECHRRGIKVFSDALGKNETIEEYRKAIDWGIDCIQTDHPLQVLRAIELSGH